jgi:hypothetical protein
MRPREKREIVVMAVVILCGWAGLIVFYLLGR